MSDLDAFLKTNPSLLGLSHDREDPLFSRSGVANPGGKCTASLKVWMTDELKNSIEREALKFGMTSGEFVRTLLEVRIWGAEHVTKVQVERTLAVANGSVTKGSA